MGNQAEKKPVKHICAGLLAHVDAGKTTLSEGLLYLCGKIRKMGRVDHGDAFLDILSWNGNGDYHLFQAGSAGGGRQEDNASGYAGARGFFGGNGAYPAGFGLCGSGN